MKLTICIPSYNRLESAKRCVSKLLKNIDGSIANIQVIDNGSDSNYAEEFSRIEIFAHAMAEGTLSIIRNSYNIGMGANFMRCFEIAKGDCLWMVADDDDLRSDALDSILMGIENHLDDCGLIVFGNDAPRYSESIIFLKSVEEFIDFNHESVDIFNRFIFLTNVVYDLKIFRSFLSIGYQYINTFIPHFMMQLAYMQRGNTCVAVQRKIVDYVVPAVGYSYSMIAGLGVGAPKHAVFKTDDKHYAKFLSLFFPHNDYKVIIDLHYICKRDGSPFVCRHLAKNYIFYISDARPFLKTLSLRLIVCLLISPKLFELIVTLMARVSPTVRKHVSEIQARYQKS